MRTPRHHAIYTVHMRTRFPFLHRDLAAAHFTSLSLLNRETCQMFGCLSIARLLGIIGPKPEDSMISFHRLYANGSSSDEMVPETDVEEYARRYERDGLNYICIGGYVVGPQDCISAIHTSGSRTVVACTADRVNSAQKVTGYTPSQAVEREGNRAQRKKITQTRRAPY